MTGLTIPVNVIEALHKKWPDRFAGIKDSSGNLDYCRILSKNRNFKVFPSSETSILEAHVSNFSGCISATVNQTLGFSSQAWTNRSQNIDSLILKIKTIREEISKDSLVPSIKYLVAKRTKNKSWTNLIPPFKQLNETRKLKLAALYNEFLL